MRLGLYQTMSNRDAVFNQLKAEGRRVRKVRSTNQLIHPQYVEDFVGPEKLDTGFGNTVYKTHFKTLYSIEEMTQ